MTVELYKHLRMRPFAVKRGPAELARQAEETGWYGGFLSDSQHFSPETWVSLGQAIEGSSTLNLAVGVTNPATRDVSVTASAAAAAYFYSGGRFVLGLGRGDSSVHKIGRKPVALEEFELRVTQIQQYLSGGTPGRDTDGAPVGLWAADMEMAKPPMDLAATGPKVIAIGARHAERVSFTVSADPVRIGWAIEQAKAACRDSGKDPDSLPMGAYVHMVVTDDLPYGRELVRGLAALAHRFTSMNTAKPLAELSENDRESATRLSGAYRAQDHALGTSEYAQTLSDEFLDRFAIIGPASYCIERISALVEQGITRLWIMPPGRETGAEQSDKMYDDIGRQVIPHLT